MDITSKCTNHYIQEVPLNYFPTLFFKSYISDCYFLYAVVLQSSNYLIFTYTSLG